MRRHSRKFVPVSSHPEADPEALHPSEAAIDSVSHEELDAANAKKKGPRREAIVSINGTDVNAVDELNKKAA